MHFFKAQQEYLDELNNKREPILDSIKGLFLSQGYNNIEIAGHSGAIHILISTKDLVTGIEYSVNDLDKIFKTAKITPQTRDLCLQNYNVITKKYNTFYLDDLNFEKISFYFGFLDGSSRHIVDFDFFY